MKQAARNKRIDTVAKWLALPIDERVPKTQKELAKSLDTTEQTIINIKNRLKQAKDDATGDEFANYMVELKRLIFSRKGTSNDRKLYAQIKGWLVEKSKIEHEFELDATSYNRIAKEVTERLREGYKQWGGICPMCGQHQALRNKSHLDTEPEHAENREVATLAVSARPD